MAKGKATKGEPYNLAPAFERAVVYYACSKPRFYGRVAYAVDPDLLTADPAKLLMKAAQAVAKDQNGKGPAASNVVVQRIRRWVDEGQILYEDLDAAGRLLDDAEDFGLPPMDDVITELAPVVRRRVQWQALQKGYDEFAKRSDEFDGTMDLIAKAKRLGQEDVSGGVRINADAFDAIEQLRNVDFLPFAIPELDRQLGGLQRGCIGLAIGGSGDGKSMFLSHVAAQSMLAGLHVIYATLELPEAVVLSRIFANLTGRPINAILDGQMEQARADIAALSLTGEVRFFTPQATTVGDIRDWWREREDIEGRKVDLVVVDYADKMSAGGGRDESTYTAGRVITEGLRMLAVDNKNWVWTASQAKGGAGKDKKKGGRIDLKDTADSQHKVRVADLVITLNASEDGEEMEWYVAKNRLGRSRFAVGPLPVDFAVGRMAMLTDNASAARNDLDEDDYEG